MAQKKMLCSLLALAGLTVSLAAAPLVAQSTQPSTQSGTTSQKPATSVKKAKVKPARTSIPTKAAPASSVPAPAAGTGNNSKVPASTKAAASSNTPPTAAGTNNRAALSAKTKAAAPAAAPPQKGMVWVNTASGVYHSEGTTYYGKTKQGKYMTEADAQKAGYHAAKGEKP